MERLGARLRAVRRGTWLIWLMVVGGITLITLLDDLYGPGRVDVTELLEQKYDVDDVIWQTGSKTRPSKLVVDGRDISDVCWVDNLWWGPVEEIEIRCEKYVGIGRVVELDE